MGKRNKKRKGEDVWREDRSRKDIPKDSPKFEAFYKAQGFLDASEFDTFMDTLRKPLPACFRLNLDYAFNQKLQHDIVKFMGDTQIINGQQVEGVQKLSWYPGEMAYKLGVDRKTIRKSSTLNEFHQWMMANSNAGNITRQEAVSMMPPLVLGVQPHHKVLDMCAAPGSKTTQMLEIISRPASEGRQQGFVVANDSDTNRAYMLVHQCRRLNTPSLLVTCHQGQLFPAVWNDAGSTISDSEGYFDRVLSDVPCSGDGTMRKSPMIWQKWTPDTGIGLHPLQLAIALRGLQLLKVGGRAVYSTCSMNPFENEAVVAEILRQYRGSVKLVDPREAVPGFTCRPGLTKWKVIDSKRGATRGGGGWWKSQSSAEGAVEQNLTEGAQSAETAEDASPPTDPLEANGMREILSFDDVPDVQRRRLRKSIFPPDQDEIEWMHLEKCMRCVPHDEDTGGFFVALIEKTTSAARATDNKPAEAEEYGDTDAVTNELPPEEDEPSSKRLKVSVDGDVEEGEDEPSSKRLKANVERELDKTELEIESTIDDGWDKGAQEVDQEDESGRIKVVQVEEVSSLAAMAEDKITPTETPIAIEQRTSNEKDEQIRPPGKFDFLQFPHEYWSEIKAFYQVLDEFPADQLVIRNEGLKSIYFIPRPMKQLLDADKRKRLKVVNLGMKMFEHNIKLPSCKYRVTQEAISLFAPYMQARKVSITLDDILKLIDGKPLSLSVLSEPASKACRDASPGTLVCDYQHDETHRFYLTIWKGYRSSVNAMCATMDMQIIKDALEALGVYHPRSSVPGKPVAESKLSEEDLGEAKCDNDDAVLSIPMDEEAYSPE